MKSQTNRAMEWIAEADYIMRTAEKRGIVPEMNHDTATFVRYCEMQRKSAEREGFVNIAAYIQSVIDDLRA